MAADDEEARGRCDFPAPVKRNLVGDCAGLCPAMPGLSVRLLEVDHKNVAYDRLVQVMVFLQNQGHEKIGLVFEDQ